ncbi:hypothetical protein GcM1_109001, partial [Golovinomyces cichoracearum]
MWDAEFQDYITMIPGLLPHFNGTAVKPLPEQEYAGKGLGNPLAPSNDLTQFKEYQALARTLLRQSCGNDDQRAKIAFLQKPSEMYLKLRSEYTTKNDSMQLRLLSDIFDVTTQKSTSVHKKIDLLRTLNFQLGNLDQDLKFHDKALAMILLKSMGDEFETTRDMIMISARKSSVTIDDIVNILASKETELNDLSIIKNETSDIVNYAGKNKGRADSRANSKSSSNYHKPLYCTFHRQTIGHIQNDCPDYLKTEPGKRWLKSDAGLAWTAFAVPELTKPHDWYLDTCASRHITPNRDFFIPGSLKPHKTSIKCANKSLISSRGIGDVNIVWEDDN